VRTRSLILFGIAGLALAAFPHLRPHGAAGLLGWDLAGLGAAALAMLLLLESLYRAHALSRYYRSLSHQLGESVLLADAGTGRIVEANPAAARELGYALRELLGRNLRDLSGALAPERLARLRMHWAAHARVIAVRGSGNRRVPFEATLSWIRIGRRELVCVVGRNVTARRALAAQRRAHRRRMARLAHRDALTGLPNRLHLEARLPRLASEAVREQSIIALLYIDLDHFRDVNESLGHSCGDSLLATVARRLRSCVAAEDLVVRAGGDEFVVVAGGLPAASTADYIARRIQESLCEPIEIEGARLNIVASIGISLCPADGTTLEQLLKHADLALSQVKAHGGGHHQFFTSEMQAQLSDRLELEHALRRAIGTEQLFLEYQPSFDLRTELPAGFEALLRWRHPRLGLVPPGRFIPIAEHDNLILELGTWVLRQVCHELAGWQREGLRLLPVSINLTTRQFEHGRLSELIAGLAREFEIEPQWLQFEITESAAMQNSASYLTSLQELRRLGSRILVDDFGTGYSSLSYLKNLPVDALKIDQAFVRDMVSDATDAAIVSAVMGIARSLGLTVIAEGVETAAQAECLARLGCDRAQGFHFSRPLPAAEARRVLERLTRRPRAGIPLAEVLSSSG
jgi:diguanylate cyclase (GGDEF)-like protein/PAS domain S-box-containing protein